MKNLSNEKSFMYEPIYVRWKKAIFFTLIFSWTIVLFSEIISGIILLLNEGQDSFWKYTIYKTILPSGLDAIIIGGISFGLFSNKITENIKNIFIIVGLSLISFVLSVSHNNFTLMTLSLVVPVFSTTAFMKKKLLYFATVFAIILLIASIPTSYGLRSLYSGTIDSKLFFEERLQGAFITAVFIVIAFFVASLTIAVHGEREKTFSTHLQENKKLNEAVKVDGLTGCFNHSAFYHDLENFVSSSRSSQEPTPISIAVIDVDDFKLFNDRYGHIKGDEVLKGVVNVVLENIVGKGLLYRYGGDEFVIIFKTERDEAYYILEKIHRSVQEKQIISEEKITLSIGLYESKSLSVSAEQMFYKADQTLYKAKFAGKNRIEVSD